MDFSIIKKLGFKLENVIHVGAHKFEELNFYQTIQSQRVLWVDPLDIYLPNSLPMGHSFLKRFVTSDEASHSAFITYENTGLSSSKIISHPRNLLFGTVGDYSQSMVPNISGRNLQEISTAGCPPLQVSICVDVQGSEWEVLKSFDLEKISEIIVETSRTNLYKKSKPYKDIINLLLDAGFYHNFNGSDFLLGHGDQYLSRLNKKYPFFQFFYRAKGSIIRLLSTKHRILLAIRNRITN
jgi:hypothetical protein